MLIKTLIKNHVGQYGQLITMYIQNRRNSSNFKGCSPHQNYYGLISLKPAIAYFAYTDRCDAGFALVVQAAVRSANGAQQREQ